jgi:hypothetical protein
VPPRPWLLAEHPAFSVNDENAHWAVVSCFFNPAGYHRPVANLGAFLDWCYAERVPVYMAELSFHDARPVLPQDSAHVVHYRMGDEGIMFQKEALLNALVPRIPERITHLFFLDADVILEGGRGVLEMSMMELVDGVGLVQPYHQAVWCDAAGRPGRPRYSTAWAWDHAQERSIVVNPSVYHTGFAYGMSRQTWSAISGLYGCPITGTGDAALFQAALAPQLPPQILGRSHYTAPSPQVWKDKVEDVVGALLPAGYVAGRCRHLYHGHTSRRFYDQRHHLLAAFRPDRDLVTQPNGLPAWSRAANPELVAAVKGYFWSRAEDS